MSDAGGLVKARQRAVRPSFVKSDSGAASTFSHSQILPDADHHNLALHSATPYGAPSNTAMSSRQGSISPESVFGSGHGEHHTEPTDLTPGQQSGMDDVGYDLKPPPPSMSQSNIEILALRFFSADHLNVILRDPTQNARFAKFLQQHKSQSAPALAEYMEMQKVLVAVEYANAVADRLRGSGGVQAASLDEQFQARSRESVAELVSDVLPAFVTHRLVQIVTDSLVKEITGNSAPIMREMIPSLAEVYCVTDPSLPDNPIVYASDEFYNISQYGKDYVIGRNCRFLQGPKTVHKTVQRLIDALAAGQEITETILNYRRDGTPFMNLLMIAPLYDNKGTVRYFLGCQIDVSPLIEGGRGLESFQTLLARDRADSRFGGRHERKPEDVLGELGAMFSEEETEIIKNRTLRLKEEHGGGGSQKLAGRGGRRILGMDDAASDRVALWPHPSLGPSGRLPGVYQNYLLVRPYPSLRITFTSPALRIPGLLQTKFLDRVGGPAHVREGVLDALAHGTSVTAKISWLMNASPQNMSGMEGKPRWIHCTPLMGSDDKVGVWMVVMVEQEEVTGQLNKLGSMSLHDGAMSPNPPGAGSARFTSTKLYNEYMRREGKESAVDGRAPSRQSSVRAPENQFQGF